MKQLVCPNCERGDELYVIEDVRIERKLGEVNTLITEYLDVVPDSEGQYREVGVQCRNCGLSIGGNEWKKALKEVEINESS